MTMTRLGPRAFLPLTAAFWLLAGPVVAADPPPDVADSARRGSGRTGADESPIPAMEDRKVAEGSDRAHDPPMPVSRLDLPSPSSGRRPASGKPATPAGLAAPIHAALREFHDTIPDSVDLSWQLPEECRDQSGVGACHTFASIALLEAAYTRNRPGHPSIQLSDADLFVQRTILRARGSLTRQVKTPEGYFLQLWPREGGEPEYDLKWALENGVAYRESATWEDFLDKYADYLEARSQDCGYPLPQKLDRSNPLAECLRKNVSLQEFFGSYTPRAPEGRLALQRRLLSAEPEKLAAERAYVKESLQGVRLASKNFFLHPEIFGDPARCRLAGRGALAAILDSLLAKEPRPVMACLRIDGLAGWEAPPDRPAGHCVTLLGYEKRVVGPGPELEFIVRNSWGVRYVLFLFEGGPRGGPIRERDLCRVGEVHSLAP